MQKTETNLPNHKEERLKARILLPLLLVFALLFGVSCFFIYLDQKKEHTEKWEAALKLIQQTFRSEIELDTNFMKALLQVVTQDETLATIFKEKDQKALLRKTLPLFQKLKIQHGISHLYFTGPDRINILRVHQPNRYGDTIDRFTTLEAERTNTVAGGLEIGPLGTFTIRAVAPWKEAGKLIGFVEFGREINRATSEVGEHFEIGLYVFVHKEVLSQKNWEEGMRMLGRPPGWDRFASTVYIGPEFEGISDHVASAMSQKCPSGGLCIKRLFTEEGEHYNLGILPIRDVSNSLMGHIAAIRNITKQTDDFHHAIMLLAGISLSLFVVVGSIFYKILGNAEGNLKTSRLKILEEGRIREKHIQALEREQAKLEASQLEQKETVESLQKSEVALLNMMEDAEEAKRKAVQAGEALRESEERVQSILDNATAVIYLKDTEGKYILVNRMYETLFHISKKEIVGKMDHDIFPKEMADTFRDNDKIVLAAQRPISLEEIAPHADGPHTYISVKFPMHDASGNIYGICGISTDITERKRMEQFITRLNDAFLKLGPDYNRNVDQLTTICGELLGADCSIYNKLKDGMLHSLGQWQTPEGYNPLDNPDGHICYDVIREGRKGEIRNISDLQKSPYYKTDPRVKALGLKTYIGCPVSCQDETIGAICGVFGKDVELSENHKMILGIIATALSNEEERRLAREETERAYKDLEATQKASLNIMVDLDRHRSELDASLQEKEVLLREIHHRVKNNMQIITSLLKLQSRYVQEKQYKEIFQESERRIKAMAMVHERLYRSQNLADIPFKDYVRSLATGLFKSYGITYNEISLKVSIDDISLEVDSAIPCGLIINELLSNSLKHAFPDGQKGEVEVSMKKILDGEAQDADQKAKPATRNPQPEIIELVVRDNGVGYPKGLDFRKTQSLGLQLVITLVESQLEGNIELGRSGGTEFKIRFEEEKYKERI